MKYKMKGHTLPGPNQKKDSPTKILSFIEHGARTTSKRQRGRIAEIAEKRIAESKESLDKMSQERGYDKVDGDHSAKITKNVKTSDKIKQEKTGYMGSSSS